MKKRNVLRELLNDGKPTIGTQVINVSPQIVEVIGHTGQFDYVQLSAEYASWTVPDLDNFARAVELFPSLTAVMKIEDEPRTFMTRRALHAGMQGILFSDCASAKDVKECIRAVRPSTPEDGGTNGCALTRDVGFLITEVGGEAWMQAMRDIVIMVMVEKREAMGELEEILAMDEVDMLNFGPCDFSVSVGKPYTTSRWCTEAYRAHRNMLELALKYGKRARVEIWNSDQAREYVDMGIRDFNVGVDLLAIYEYCRQNGGDVRELLLAKG
ncbi:MAG: aldolase/citrate lyase family protein [Chloroflexota bacterium]